METRNSGNRDAGVKRRAKSAARMADKYLAPQLVAGFVAVPATANLPHVSPQSYGVACPSGYGLALRRDESQRRVAETSVRAGAGLEADARTVSLALGGSLNPPPPSSCRRQWRQPSLAGERGRIGDGFFPG
jgi:hypothetical protein